MNTSRPGHVTVAAVDLGASNGRVMLGRVGPDRLELLEAHRFANGPVAIPSANGVSLHWNVVGLFEEILAGLRAAQGLLADGEHIASIGIDTWGVDYGLLDADGQLLGVPHSYRDVRGSAAMSRVHDVVQPGELYARNGLQPLPINTVYQLTAEQTTARWPSAHTMLLLPDLFVYWLTGQLGAESTMASTTGLLRPLTGTWDLDLADQLGIASSLLPPLRHPGEVVGTLLPHVATATGLSAATKVVAVGSHDTASAVLAVPAVDGVVAYVCSGTWSLVGMELTAPVLSEASRLAGFTNEGGVGNRIRYLRNLTGLWLLSESMRSWRAEGLNAGLDDLLRDAARLPAGGPVVQADDPEFTEPGDMPARIRTACRKSGQPPPSGPADVVRCILDSLAVAYARALDDARTLSGLSPAALHVVGGGSRNALLNRLTADATGLPVLAGPTEASALGNVLVQAGALDAVAADPESLRELVRRTSSLTEFRPTARSGARHQI